MGFCINCGQKFLVGQKFCTKCGTPVTGTDCGKDYNSDIGVSFKCPSCGGILNTLSVVCPFCGMIMSTKTSSNSVKSLVMQLDKIDSEDKGVWNNIINSIQKELSGSDNIAKEKLQRKISLIRNFPVPNSIDEIIEFMLLAETNINIRLSKNTLLHRWNKLGTFNREPLVMLSDTWVEKMQSLYRKSELLFQSSPAFIQVQQIYERKMKELKIKY